MIRVYRLLQFVALGALCLLAAACGPQQGSTGSAALRIWYSTDDPTERVWSQQLARRFERSHPGVTVQLTDYSFEDLNTKLQLALSAGRPPDLAYVTPRGPGIPAYLQGHELRDLTSAAQTGGWAARLQPGLLAAYNRPFGFEGAPKGHIMAVPTSLAAVGILYNKRLLSRLHLTDPTTLAAFERDLAVAKRAGYTPIGMGNEDGWLGDDWYLTLVNASVPPQMLQPEQTLSPAFTFQRPPYQRAAATMQRWAQRGYFTPSFGGFDAQEGLDLFFRGKTLFQLVSSSENSQILVDEHDTGLPIGLFAFPRPGGGTVMASTGYLGWVVPARAQHPGQAVDFINSLLTQSTASFLLQHGVLPAMRVSSSHAGAGWQRSYLQAFSTARPGIYIDAAPITNLNATMEANVQLLLQGYEPPQFLVTSLQKVYASHGKRNGSTARIDGEF
jgi:raffinose/stachyose/melibiose transport system substrate-binding protein